MVNYLHEIAPHVEFIVNGFTHYMHYPSKWHVYELGYFLKCYLLAIR
jgi:hypothetical protein